MKDLLKEPLTIIVVYFIMVIFTFGHAYNNYPEEEPGYFAGTTYVIHNGPGTITFGALACSVAWPLYWSVKLQEKK